MLKDVYMMYRENPKVLVATIAGLFAGACLGIFAYFGGWLG